MKSIFRFLLLLPFCGLALGAQAQVLDPVKWTFFSRQAGEGTYELHLKAVIDPGWHVYAQDAGDGPIPTSFTFEDHPGVTLIGHTEEKGKEIKTYDKVFTSTLRYYEDSVDFVQRVKIKKGAVLKGTLEYMVCNDVSCLPPKDVPFGFTLGNPAVADRDSAKSASPGNTASAGGNGQVAAAPPDQVIPAGSGDDNASGKSLGWIFLGCFGAGFVALLLPCIYSMIPITVSFFIKRGETRGAGIKNALLYSLSIIFIYTFLGFVITLIFGPSALNQLSSNIWANLAFFVIFLLFGFSFLGAFEIALPASWSTRTGTKSGVGSFWGIFFMALTLAIVSFSCTGPLIGNLLYLAAKGGKAGPLVGMFGFSLALAIPFALFAIFPEWLHKIGKAGGWLNAIKVVLGLLELALAMKFLSNVDMAYHWGILSKEVFLAVWIVLFGLIGIYLLGKIKFRYDSDVPHLSVTRLLFAIAAFSFMVYLIPGLFGANLKGLIGGFLPTYSSISGGSRMFGSNATSGATYDGIQPQKYTSIFGNSTPEGYTAFYDYDEAIAAARKLKKPLMIDFTGWSCVNCRKMENEVWTDPSVRSEINRDFILLQLYVDDKTVLADSAQYTSSFDGSRITRLGNKNADFEIVKFNRNSQPYYVFLDQDGRMLTERGYSAADGYSPENFLHFLERAKTEYETRNP